MVKLEHEVTLELCNHASMVKTTLTVLQYINLAKNITTGTAFTLQIHDMKVLADSLH